MSESVRLPSTQALAAVNVCLLLLSIAAGWSLASSREASILDQRQQEDVTRAPLLRDALFIWTSNLKVVGLIVLGIWTLGVLSAGVLFWNGYVLGFGLSALSRGAPEALPLVMTYVPLEFASFALASAASMRIGFVLVNVLRGSRTLRIGSACAGLAAAIACLFVAALIEAAIKRTPVV